MTRLLQANRPLLLAAIRQALSGSSPLERLARRHVGVEGEPVDAAGKLLRPCLVLFAASELGGDTSDALPAAIALELVHNFSLVHDDIQDRDRTRRGRPTLWTVCGEAEAINAGDFLHAVAFREAARCGSQVVACLAGATIEMVEGQSLDLANESQFVDLSLYLTMIDKKTGALLRCAFELGALVAGAEESVRVRFRELGAALGRAFQIRDDALGIWGDGAELGKPKGSDVRRRKKSFPAVWTHARAGAADRGRLEAVYSGESVSDADAAWVVALMERVGAPDAAAAAVREHTDVALRLLERLPLSTGGRMDLRDVVEDLAGRSR